MFFSVAAHGKVRWTEIAGQICAYLQLVKDGMLLFEILVQMIDFSDQKIRNFDSLTFISKYLTKVGL